MEKTKVSQDFLYKFITDNGINVSTLAELMGMSATMVNGCFRHNKDNAGRARKFPNQTLPKLNEAIVILAAQIRNSMISFGSPMAYKNKHGREYDPACIEPINALHRYFKITQFLASVLGWTANKKSITLHTPSSRGFGCISRDDIDRINARLLAVAGMLESIEIVTL